MLIMPPNNFTDMIRVEENHHSAYYVHYPHLGLMYLAAACEQAGMSVMIIDALVEKLGPAAVLERTRRACPKIVGLTVTTPTLRICYRLAKAMRTFDSPPEVVLGGPHVSADPEVLGVFPCRYALRGEADFTFVTLAERLISGKAPGDIEGLVVKEGDLDLPAGSVQTDHRQPVIRNLDPLPFPARHLCPNHLYRNPVNSLTTTAALTVRGCPFDCLFCSRAVRGQKTDGRSLGDTMAELADIEERFGIQYATLMDETFTFSKKYVSDFCRAMRESSLRLQWGAQTRADLVSEEMLLDMRDAGCRLISFGVESGSERIRKLLHKPVEEAHYRQAIELCRKAGIETNTFWILGHPTETREELEQTLRFCVELDPTYASFNITNVFVGAPIYDQMLREGKLDRTIWDRYTLGEAELPLYVPEGMTEGYLRAKIAEGFRRFYLRPRPIMNRMRRWASLSELRHDLHIMRVLATQYMVPRFAQAQR